MQYFPEYISNRLMYSSSSELRKDDAKESNCMLSISSLVLMRLCVHALRKSLASRVQVKASPSRERNDQCAWCGSYRHVRRLRVILTIKKCVEVFLWWPRGGLVTSHGGSRSDFRSSGSALPAHCLVNSCTSCVLFLSWKSPTWRSQYLVRFSQEIDKLRYIDVNFAGSSGHILGLRRYI